MVENAVPVDIHIQQRFRGVAQLKVLIKAAHLGEDSRIAVRMVEEEEKSCLALCEEPEVTLHSSKV